MVSADATRLIDVLEHDDRVVDPTLDRVRTEIPAYAIIPDALIAASLRRNLQLAVRILRAGVVPSKSEIWQAEKTTLERLRAGMAIEDIMAGFRISISSVQDRLAELAEQLEVEDAEVVRLTRLLWKLGDVFSAQGAATYRRYGVASDLAEQRLRDELLSALLNGRVDEPGLERSLTALRLDRDREYVAFCARPTEAIGLEAAQRELIEQMRGQTCLVVPTEGRLAGVLADVPRPVHGLLVAVGTPCAPAALHEGFEIACRVLDASATDGEAVQSLDALGWRVAVPDDDSLLTWLRARYLHPLARSRGSTAPLLEAVAAYLEHDSSIPRAASALHVHVNTLRYRLARFEELTGCLLSRTDSVIEVSWLLRAEKLLTS